MKIKDAVIVAGGQGTRISNTFQGPKALLPLNGKAIIQDQLEKLASAGVEQVFLLLGTKGDEIEKFVRNLDLDLVYEFIHESNPLGTGGALLNAYSKLPEVFFFLYGDIYFDENLNKLTNALNLDPEAGGAFYFHASSHPWDSDLIVLDENFKSLEFLPKGSYNLQTRNLCLCGVYLLKKSFLPNNKENINQKIDFEKDILRKQFADISLVGVRNTKVIRDVGTDSRYKSFIENAFISPINEKGVIFLDRDGVINKNTGHVSEARDFILIESSLDAIVDLKRAGWKVIVITNQPVIARGELDLVGLDALHSIL